MTDSYLYTSYGKPVTFSSNYYNQYRYGAKYGYYTEVSTGFVLATQRWYSPELMRWVSKDPIGYDGGVNLYEYVKNAPTKYVDVSGEIAVPIVIGFCEAAPHLCVAVGAATVALITPAFKGVKNAIAQCANVLTKTRPKTESECFIEYQENLERECWAKPVNQRECEESFRLILEQCKRSASVPTRD